MLNNEISLACTTWEFSVRLLGYQNRQKFQTCQQIRRTFHINKFLCKLFECRDMVI
jgi:hypothetical protein